jgi:hypothetical protein
MGQAHTGWGLWTKGPRLLRVRGEGATFHVKHTARHLPPTLLGDWCRMRAVEGTSDQAGLWTTPPGRANGGVTHGHGGGSRSITSNC